MSNVTLTIAVDKLSPSEAQLLAGFILAYTKGAFEQEMAGDDSVSGIVKMAIAGDESVDPSQLFGKAPGAVAEAPVSIDGPHLVIPNPPPAATPSPIAPPASGVILDSSGLPWDGRIHASSKATNADGTWRFKRGVEKPFIESVTAELRKVMASPGPTLVQAPPPPQPVQQASAAAPPPPPSQSDPDAARKMYIDLVGRASAAKGNGKISQEQINECLQAVGVETMSSLGIRLDLVPTACALIDGIIAGKNA